MLQFIFKSRLTLLAGSALLILMIIGTVKVSVKNNHIQGEIDSLQAELQTLQVQNERLRGQMSDSQNEEYLELQAKRKLNLKRPAESVFVFYADQGDSVTASPTADLAKFAGTTPSNPVLWWRYFFK